MVIYRYWGARDVGCPRFPTNLGEILRDLSTPREIPFRTLIAARKSPFSHFAHPPRGVYFPKCGGSLAAIRVRNAVAGRASSIAPRSPGNRGRPVDIPRNPFLVSNHGLESAKFRIIPGARGAAEMEREMRYP